MYDGIILAGGFSSRANTNKMSLEYKGKPLILNTIETMHEVCENIIVVTGHYHESMIELFFNIDYVKVVYNKHYSDGMFSSIKVGVLATSNSFFIIPGDYPNVEANTYNYMIEVDKPIVVPSYQNRLGHPILFDKSFRNKILTTDHSNLKDFRNDFNFGILEVDDSGILFDVDDLNDYKKLLRKE
ncbi:MAG: NTP transferase domain-containing protein [Tenericutes bacterium]|nr:NTP transferase domain-containing protein [Mycoplasmatota bacterium]